MKPRPKKEPLFSSEETYRGLGHAIREQILKSYAPDSCIATCAATVDILKNQKIDAYALAVSTIIVNKVLYDKAVELGGRYPELGSEEYPHGGYGIYLGAETVAIPGRWPGHLVVIAERKWMLDFSIDQANRPIYGIDLQPLVIPITEPFLRGREYVVYRHANTYLYYHPRVGDKSFETSTNWSGEYRPTTHVQEAK